jgi:hypothetical protein
MIKKITGQFLSSSSSAFVQFKQKNIERQTLVGDKPSEGRRQ